MQSPAVLEAPDRFAAGLRVHRVVLHRQQAARIPGVTQQPELADV
jgi:hypothetical protein